MTNTAQWGVLVGSLLPPLAAWLQRQTWPKELNAAIFLAGCMAAATATSYIDRSTWSWDQWIQTALWVIGSGLGSYHALWKPTGVIAKARAIGPVK